MSLFDSPGSVRSDDDKRWQALNDRLFSLARKGMILGLERLEPVLEQLGHPEKALKYVHVAGTNGKGSSCAFLASILSQANLNVGVYTSPHLDDLTERLKWFSKSEVCDVPRDDMRRAIEKVEKICPNFEPLTFFEVITVAVLILMAKRQPDYGIIEAGLGARLDATRMVDAELSILTDISLDHCAYLGDTLPEIAAEKLAVIRPMRPLVAAPSLEMVSEAAEAAKSPLFQLGHHMRAEPTGNGGFDLVLSDRRIQNVCLGLEGAHQLRNALLAAQAAVLLEPQLTEEQIRLGLLTTRWPGRLEWGEIRNESRYLFDAAHNPAGAEMLARYLQGMPATKWHFVFGAMGNKDLKGMIEPLLPLASSWTITHGDSPRYRQATEIKKIFNENGAENCAVSSSPWAAYERAADLAKQDQGCVVICGSIFLIGELRGKLATHSKPVLP